MAKGWRKPDPRARYVSIRHGEKTLWEHRLIAEKALGKPLPEGAEIHHVNNRGRENTGVNLVICQDHAYHFLLHKRERILRLGADPNTHAWCSFCRKPQPIVDFWVRKSGAQKGRLTTNCRNCERTRRALRSAGRPAVPESECAVRWQDEPAAKTEMF